MRSMGPLYCSCLCKDLACSQMYPVVLSEGSVLTDGLLFESLNRRQYTVFKSKSWIRLQKRGPKVSPVGFLKLNKQNNTGFGIRRGGKRSMMSHSVPQASTQCSETDAGPSATHNLAELDSGRSKEREDCGLAADNSEQQPKTYKQLGILDSYFNKLHGKADQGQGVAGKSDKLIAADVSATKLEPNQDELVLCAESKSTEEDEQLKMATELDVLDNYIKKLNPGRQDAQKDDIPETNRSDKTRNNLTTKEAESTREFFGIVNKMIKDLDLGSEVVDEWIKDLESEVTSKLAEDNKDILDGPVSSTDVSYNSYLINTLAAINIAVFFFELASPVKSSDAGILSLPLLFGAKINELILNGEWWRLITPMFLHSGLLHIAFSSWALLTFGPLVDTAYGSFAFCMIYFLGGVCGNLMSFFHTPDATVGGTGPVLAIIGSWIIYLFQNREALGEEMADNLIQKVAVASVLSVALSYLTPIDDWTHLGAAFAGLIFGVFICPVVPVHAPSKKLSYDPNDSQEGFLLVSQWPDARKLFTVFTLFVVTLVSLFFVLAPVVTEFHLSDMSNSF